VRSQRSGVVLVLYEAKAGGKGMLNKGYFQQIESWEAAVRSNQKWKDVCLADADAKNDNPPCSESAYFSPFDTVNKYMRTDNGLATGASLDSLSDAQFEASFRKLMKMGGTAEKTAWLTARGSFDKYISADNFTLTYAQTVLQPASPLNVGGKRYKNQTDEEQAQFKIHKEFAQWLKKDAKENLKDGGYEAAPWSTILLADEFEVILYTDMAFAFFSVTFVFFYLSFHLRSCWLALVGVSLILFSFPFTVVISEGIFQVTYFGTL